MKHDYLSWVGSVFGTILTAVQSDQIFQYISLALTILSTLIAILYTIWKWWRKAKEDGKIDGEEVKDLVDQIDDVVKKGEDKDEKHK
jgi:hypothetical protein